MIPAPTPIVIAVLSELPSVGTATDRVSSTLLTPLPALRVTKVGDQESPSSPAIAPLFQVEIWADDELEAERIAWAISDEWPTARPEVVRDAYVHGRWVSVLPHPANDPETGLARQLLTVGLYISGVTS